VTVEIRVEMGVVKNLPDLIESLERQGPSGGKVASMGSHRKEDEHQKAREMMTPHAVFVGGLET
jgi:hypothetical protein